MLENKEKKLELLRNFKSLLIREAKIYDPISKKDYVSNVLIENGYLKSIDARIDLPDFKKIKDFQGNSYLKKNGNQLIIDASKNILCPAFFDMHVHFREPGDEDEETVKSGIDAALSSGINAVACMPNTRPPVDSENLVKYLVDCSKIYDFKIFPVAAMSKGIKGIEVSEMGLLSEAGAVAFSDDGHCVQDAKLMYEIMRYSRQFDKVLILHEEDYSFSGYGLVHEGFYSTKLGLDGISSLSEETMIARDIMLSKKTGAKIHITHVSSKGSVELIKKAKEENIKITSDVTPHHLFFDDSFLDNYDTNFKVNPPIRSIEDREALVEGIKKGIIDTIASDHAPHLETEKNTTFKNAVNGAIGMETLFKSAYTCLCKKEKISLMDLIRILTTVPYRILGISNPLFKEGQKANIVIIDTDAESVIRKDSFRSKSSNSPFIGHRLHSDIICTINNGNISFFNYDLKK
jgi:dihydroorotase